MGSSYFDFTRNSRIKGTQKMGKLLLLSLLALCFIGSAFSEYLMVCYVGTWATYRQGNGKFDVENINPAMCTHLMYSFFGINTDGTMKILDPYLDLEENWGRGNIKKFNNLKKINPKLKTIAAVGGWNEGSKKFSIVAASAQLRQNFAKDAANFCIKHGFDGLDLDWEYPAQRDGDPVNDRANHVLLVKAIREEFDKHGFELLAAVASAEFSAGKSYNIPEMSKYLHYINVMAYDIHGAWESNTGLNAPLYAGPNDKTELELQLNLNASLNYWIDAGAPRGKLILGMPLYGRTFTLSKESEYGIGAKANGPGQAGQYTREPGFIGYNEFCENLKTQSWTMEWSDEQHTPYAHKGNQWIGFDDVKSLAKKVDFMKSLGLGGSMVWSLETDDFRNVCGQGQYPLMNTIIATMNGGVTPPPLTTTQPPPTTPSTTTTRDPTAPTNPPGECKQDGTFRDPNDCSKYFICANGQKFEFQCPPGLLFNDKSKVCDWPENVEC